MFFYCSVKKPRTVSLWGKLYLNLAKPRMRDLVTISLKSQNSSLVKLLVKISRTKICHKNGLQLRSGQELAQYAYILQMFLNHSPPLLCNLKLNHSPLQLLFVLSNFRFLSVSYRCMLFVGVPFAPPRHFAFPLLSSTFTFTSYTR